MPKMKTHKATSKRFRRTKGGKGKLMRTRAGQGHFRRNRRKSRKSRFYQLTSVKDSGTRKRVRRLMPHIGRLSTHKRDDSD